MKLFKKIVLWGLGGLLLGILVCFWSNFEIESKTQNFVTDDIEKLPNQKVGVLLGTSKTLPSGYKNYYFYYRIDYVMFSKFSIITSFSSNVNRTN